MAVIDLAALTSPVAGDDPCGIDLDLAGDSEFMNFMARAEGMLPAAFFSGPDGKPFDRSSIDVNAEYDNAKPFLAKTRDLRLLLTLGKFCVLTRDLEGFVVFVGAVAKLLEEQWDGVHPRDEDDEFGIRLAVIDTLDDAAPVILPLQYVRLIEDKRLGAISYRSFMFANGEAQPREGEELRDLTALDKALMETDLANVIERRRQIEALQTALGTIAKVCVARTGRTVSLDKVTALSEKIFGLLNATVAKRDPSAAVVVAEAAPAADEVTSGAAPAVASRIASKTEAALALAAVGRYLSQAEPSNPALLLVRQAEQLMGKSLLEVMQILMPSQLDQAKFWIGKDRAFDIPIERLAPFASIESLPEESVESAAGQSEPAELANPSAPDLPSATAGQSPSVRSRQDVFAVLDQLTLYFRAAEPSSPISLITERARALGERDFLTLLKDLLPPST